MADKLSIGVIVGSVREGRASLPVAEWVADEAKAHARLAPVLIDLAEWRLPMLAVSKPPMMGYVDDTQKRWAAEIGRHDGYIFVLPEYNRGMSAVVKNAVDYLYAEWQRKPAAFVAHGSQGGLGATQALRAVLGAINMAPLGNAVHLLGVAGKTGGGRFSGDERDAKALAKTFDDLAWWAGALKAARDA